MDERLIMVSMGQIAVSRDPGDVLVALGLGSCIAVCAYDPLIRAAGMIHVVLPSSAAGRSDNSPAKFADQGVPRLIGEMEKEGSLRVRLKLAILGGANVLSSAAAAEQRRGLSANHNAVLDVGRRNIDAVVAALQQQGLSIVADHVGGKVSRTVRLGVASGEVTVRTIRDGEISVASLRSAHVQR